MAELGWKTGRARNKNEFELAENAQKTLEKGLDDAQIDYMGDDLKVRMILRRAMI